MHRDEYEELERENAALRAKLQRLKGLERQVETLEEKDRIREEAERNAKGQAGARPSDSHISRYGTDPNEPSIHDTEMIKRSMGEFRRNLYG